MACALEGEMEEEDYGALAEKILKQYTAALDKAENLKKAGLYAEKARDMAAFLEKARKMEDEANAKYSVANAKNNELVSNYYANKNDENRQKCIESRRELDLLLLEKIDCESNVDTVSVKLKDNVRLMNLYLGYANK